MLSNRKVHYSLISSLLGILLLAGACSAASSPSPTVSSTPFSPATSTPLPPSPTTSPSPAPTSPPTATTAPTAAPDPVSSLPDPAGVTWSPVAAGLTQPIGLTSAGDGSGRLFIIEQPGTIRIYHQGQLLDSPFLDIQDRVRDSGSEQGLLGLAFDPDYEDNGYFFVNYTNSEGDTAVSRFQVSENISQADPASESNVLTFNQPFQNHNGGQILFGPQGYLWIATGDGGGAGDPQENAQKLDNLLGKLLRIDVSQQPYALPEGNPFGNEIWAYGLRNPWRFTFDPVTGGLYIADVGQDQAEEINFLPADAQPGANFGWDYYEGSLPYEGTPPEDLELTFPVTEYQHPTGCSVSGGAVYRGALPAWQGVYLYGDFCSGLIWGLLQTPEGEWQNELLFETSRRIAAIDQDENGEVYLVDINGAVLKLTARE